MSTITVTRQESAAEERYYVATQWQLIGRRFVAHRLALLGSVVLVILYGGPCSRNSSPPTTASTASRTTR